MNQSKELTREIHPSNSEKEVNSSNNGKKQQECNKYIYSRWMVFLVLMSSIAVTLYFHNGKHNSPVKNNSAEFLMPPNPQRTDTKPVPSYTQLHIFKQAAVCSDSQVCSQVGRNGMKLFSQQSISVKMGLKCLNICMIHCTQTQKSKWTNNYVKCMLTNIPMNSTNQEQS
uniref:(northern house mosquito) hypothetical protein n=1 Tax=Culex pipiens TaxID=7175 RepID=A0A8D8H3P2_CULPI